MTDLAANAAAGARSIARLRGALGVRARAVAGAFGSGAAEVATPLTENVVAHHGVFQGWREQFEIPVLNGQFDKGPLLGAGDGLFLIGGSAGPYIDPAVGNGLPYFDGPIEVSDTSFSGQWQPDFVELELNTSEPGAEGYFEKMIPVSGTLGEAIQTIVLVTIKDAGATGLGGQDFVATAAFLDVLGAEYIGGDVTTTVDVLSLVSGATVAVAPNAGLGDGVMPSDAGFLRVRLGIAVDTAADTSRAIVQISSLRVLRYDEYLAAVLKESIEADLATVYQPLDSDLTDIAALTTTSYGRSVLTQANAAALRTLAALGTVATLASDTDTALAANSDSRVATQKATKAYVDTAVTGLLEFRGSTDCSASPNYPAANKGDAYVVTVAGKIGGASGKSVDVGDMYLATADNAGGTEATVGTSWSVLEHNLVGAILSGSSAGGDLTGTYPNPSLAAGVGTPAGAVMAYAGSSAPTGYVLCDGSSLPRASYAALFTAIGTAFGSADVTHFNVPDLRGAFPIGLKSTDTDFDVLNDQGGAKTHTHAGHSAHVVTQPSAHSAHAVTQPSAHSAHVVTQPAAHVVTQPGAHSAISSHAGSAVADPAAGGTGASGASGTGASGAGSSHTHTGPSHTHTGPSHQHDLPFHFATGVIRRIAATVFGSSATTAAATQTVSTTASTTVDNLLLSGSEGTEATGASGSAATGGEAAHTHTGPSHTHTGPSHTHTQGAVTQPDAHSSISAHSGTAVDAHSGTAVDAHSAHSGTAVDAHSAHSGTAVDAHSAHDTPSSMPPFVTLNYIIKT